MNKKKLYPLLAILLSLILFSVVFSGCVQEAEEKVTLPPQLEEVKTDSPSILPDWTDGKYHDYDATTQMINNFNRNYPDLVYVKSIGKSVQGKDIWCMCLTNESSTRSKFSCLIDGCIHGCEWEAGEACLYLTEYLLINYGLNSTITDILDGNEIYIVPLLNPDARDADSRFNDNGIDVCRNFDIDFGRLRGSAIPLGKLFGRVKIPVIRLPFFGYVNNCGRKPFSEPETKAIANLMKELKNNRFSFYLNCHTAIHSFFSPWSAFRPPFEISDNDMKVFDFAGDWVNENSEYESEELSYCASGTAIDWCFKEFHTPCFVLEILSKDYEPWLGGGKHDHLVHWMKTTLPVFMYLLVNTEELYQWELPIVEPPLPDGIPPSPLH